MSDEVISSGIKDWGSIPHTSIHEGVYWFRLGVNVVTVDAGICLNANNIVKFERALVTA